ncbi:hypothetical protein [uncultured Litoreibacter sp.]|uniref:hypothetical protein n=1 Tax=uncultured Litoreibacter sp. TaxID=1392394 RepID=UPI002636F8C6|nr:hypothetical protein [uncultured Litoreibacter sp.]
MFKFLFGKKSVEAVKETQRETVIRAMGEVNDILALMAEKPNVSVDLNTGLVHIVLPEQMPDEALALPAPEDTPEPEGDTTEPEPDTEAKDDAEEEKAAA